MLFFLVIRISRRILIGARLGDWSVFLISCISLFIMIRMVFILLGSV